MINPGSPSYLSRNDDLDHTAVKLISSSLRILAISTTAATLRTTNYRILSSQNIIGYEIRPSQHLSTCADEMTTIPANEMTTTHTDEMTTTRADIYRQLSIALDQTLILLTRNAFRPRFSLYRINRLTINNGMTPEPPRSSLPTAPPLPLTQHPLRGKPEPIYAELDHIIAQIRWDLHGFLDALAAARIKLKAAPVGPGQQVWVQELRAEIAALKNAADGENLLLVRMEDMRTVVLMRWRAATGNRCMPDTDMWIQDLN